MSGEQQSDLPAGQAGQSFAQRPEHGRQHLRALVATAAAVAGLSACVQEPPPTPAGPLVSTGVIFTAEHAEQFAATGAGARPPFWTPTADQVAAAEARLDATLTAMSNERAYVLSRNLGSYRRQYLGDSPGGRPQVLISGFCEAFWHRDDSWQHRLVDAKDGADRVGEACFFAARYDVETDSVTSLQIGNPD